MQAFKITVSDDSHFTTIKNDKRSRVQDTAITADTLLPDGPYNVWRDGETSRRVKDLAGAFAQLPHLPKMLKSQAIKETLVDGCAQGTFVLKLSRPDRTFRTWWRTRPDDVTMDDPAIELVLPQAAELGGIPSHLLAPKVLPDLWAADQITVQTLIDYFNGTKLVQVDKGGFTEAVPVPKASAEVIEAAIDNAVSTGGVWLSSGPASLLGEPIPVGVLNPMAKLQAPPEKISAAAILPENLPGAWSDGQTTALAIATALSLQAGVTLPWKTVRNAIGRAIQARFLSLAADSSPWPSDLAAAQTVKLQLATAVTGTGVVGAADSASRGWTEVVAESKRLVAEAELEPSGIQDLADLIPELLEIKNRFGTPVSFRVRIEFGDGKESPSLEATGKMNELLENLKDGFSLR